MSSLAVSSADVGQQTPVLPLRECQNCGATDKKLQLCAQCHFARYCGRECQRAAWPKHKDACDREAFWKKVKAIPTKAQDKGPVFVGGRMVFPTLAAGQKEMTLACNRPSDYVYSELVASPFQGTVLDLGCGLGVNSLPLCQKGCTVTAIDQEPEAIQRYSGLAAREAPNRLHAVVGDITEVPFPENIDALIAVDVLPYIHPERLKATMEKVCRALRPEGTFVGTLFFNEGKAEHPIAELLGRLGAHFCPSREFARELITRSGLQIKKERERKDEGDLPPHCIEFVATKPRD